MSAPWWTREAQPAKPLLRLLGNETPEPMLVSEDADEIEAGLFARAPHFTPEWKSRRADDAGTALARVQSGMQAPIHERANRVPAKAFVEYLRAANVEGAPATAAQAVVEFTLSDAASRPVLISRGFQLGAPATDGSGEMVTFETAQDLIAAPLKLKEILTRRDSRYSPVTLLNEPGFQFLPFGERASPGRSLYLGFSARTGAEPGTGLTLYLGVASPTGAPPPYSAGSLNPAPIAPPVRFEWQVLDGGVYTACELVRDETAHLQSSGLVELKLPRRWRAGVPESHEGPPLLWLRMRLAHGTFVTDPKLTVVAHNAANCLAARTIRGEALEPVPATGDGVSRMRLSQRPVLADTLLLDITDDRGPTRWTETTDLFSAGPEDRVYTLDESTGVVAFGDGMHGRALPAGFRHVVAASYRVGGGRAGAVEAGKLTALISSAPFVTGAKNRFPASGGADAEPTESILRKGPQEIRARNRAVTEADYELMALRAPGASIARARAVSGLHASFRGGAIPGVVGVLIVASNRGEDQPVPDEGTLRAVAKYLSATVAPAGVEVVAAAPRFHQVRLEGAVVLKSSVDVSASIQALLRAANKYLSPLTGGKEGIGWTFGGTLVYNALLRQLLEVPGVLAIPRLTIIADGLRRARCTDFVPAPHALLWPVAHEFIPVDASEASA